MGSLIRRLAAGVVLATALLGVGAASASTSSLDVVSVETDNDVVTAIVAPPPDFGAQDLTTAAWTVSEGGQRVAAKVTPVSNANLEVVLLFDTSGSMAGAALEAAKSAAEAFLGGLPTTARVAVVAFSSKPVVVTPLTADRAAAVAAVRGLRAQGETALYDGVVAASGLFSPAESVRRELVVLSDGGDTVSAATKDAAIESLTRAKATAYVASLVTKDSAAAVLEDLARRSGGRLVGATDLAAIRSVFGAISTTLTNQYRVTFTARGTGQTTLAVAVTAGGATASADRVIELPRRTTPVTVAAPYVATAPANAWMKTAGVATFAVGLLLIALLLCAPGKKRRRIASAWIADHATRGADSNLHELTHRAADFAERSLGKRGWATRLDAALERAGVPLRPGEFALACIAAELGVAFVGATLFGPLVAMGLVIGAGLAIRSGVRMKVGRRRAHFEEQLSDTLQLLSGSLRAGYGLAQALDAVAKNSESPTTDEFSRLIMETRVGRSLPDALAAMAARVGSQDFEWVVEAMTINREVGGDLTELLDRAAATIRERDGVRRQIKSLSAEGRLSGYVLVGMPIGLFLYLKLSNPTYIGELTASTVGWMLLIIATTMMTLGALWMRKLVRVVF